MKSKFRKLFWARIAFGLTIFVMLLLFLIFGLDLISYDTRETAIVSCLIFMTFLIFLSLSLFKIFTLEILEKNIELTYIISKKKKTILISSILNIEKQRVVLRNRRGNVTDGFYVTVLIFAKDSLVISPDTFENYEELTNDIRIKFMNQKTE